MYLEEIENKLPGQRVKIKYDCNGGFSKCGTENTPIFKVARKNFADNKGKHICKSCSLKANNPMASADNKEKVKKTNLEKYGQIMPMNSKENIEKRKELFQDKDYVENILAKRKKTCKEIYGTEFAQQNETVKEKQKQTMLDNYGVEHPYQSKIIMDKMKANNLEKYGVENVAQIPEVQIKMAKTMLANHGVEHYNQLPEMKEYLRENCKEWLKESYETGGPNIGVPRPEAWNQKQSETMKDKILAGEINPEDKRFYITGYYDSKKCKKPKAFFRSRLELMMHYILDNDINVEWYENEPFSIKYEKSSGIFRNYIPDFFVFYSSSKPKILEIKPAFRMKEQEVIYKIEAGHAYAEINGFEFVYIDEIYLKNNSISFEQLKLLPQVELILNKN